MPGVVPPEGVDPVSAIKVGCGIAIAAVGLGLMVRLSHPANRKPRCVRKRVHSRGSGPAAIPKYTPGPIKAEDLVP